jgi:hypothetical protein
LGSFFAHAEPPSWGSCEDSSVAGLRGRAGLHCRRPQCRHLPVKMLPISRFAAKCLPHLGQRVRMMAKLAMAAMPTGMPNSSQPLHSDHAEFPRPNDQRKAPPRATKMVVRATRRRHHVLRQGSSRSISSGWRRISLPVMLSGSPATTGGSPFCWGMDSSLGARCLPNR